MTAFEGFLLGLIARALIGFGCAAHMVQVEIRDIRAARSKQP